MTELNRHDAAIRLLAQGFATRFAEELAGDERVHDIMMEVAEALIERDIPIVRDEDKTDLAVELMMNVTVKVV